MRRPSKPFIKANCIPIGRNDAEPGGPKASLGNFELCARKQQPPDAGASIALMDPEVVDPLVLSEHHAHNYFPGRGDPGKGPILTPDRDWRIGPKSSIDLVDDCLNEIPHDQMFADFWAANLDFTGDLVHLTTDFNCRPMLRRFLFA